MKNFRLLIAGLIMVLASSSFIFAQTEMRTIKFVKEGNEPLKIIKLTVSGKEISLDQPFKSQNEDWFRNLSVTVKNVSNQTINSIDVELIFPSMESYLPSLDHLFYGCEPILNTTKTSRCPQSPLEPNETVNLVLKDYEDTRNYLTRTGKPQNLTGFQIRIGRTIFADESMWYVGQIHKRDPNDPTRWLPEKKSKQ